MAVTNLCTQADVENLWSLYGVSARIDDADTVSGTTRMNAMLEKASVDVNYYLLQRYDVAQLTSNQWVTWAATFFCACDLARRRGNAPPQSMFEESERYRASLLEIKQGKAHLISDTGRASPKFDNSPMLSNMRIDTRFRAGIRRVVHTSTLSPQAPGRKNYETVGPYPYLYW